MRELRFAEADAIQSAQESWCNLSAIEIHSAKVQGLPETLGKIPFKREVPLLSRTNGSLHFSNLHIEKGFYSAHDLYGAPTCDSLGPSTS